jgi:peptidoglycan/xylan/chitin deacetylase (PgdA/CDA1 family)
VVRTALTLVLVGVAIAITPAALSAPASGTAIPILEYHVIGNPAPGAPLPGLYLSVADFRSQLDWLAAHGYQAVTLDQIWRSWTGGGALPNKPVVLTFDDGYPPDVSVVRPLLLAHHWPGNLNLQIGNLVPVRVRELIHAGWEIDAHTFQHHDLTTESGAELAHDVGGSGAWIRSVFHVPADFFCYPAGRYDAKVITAVQQGGFKGAEAETHKAAVFADRWALGRYEILRGTGSSALAALLH